MQALFGLSGFAALHSQQVGELSTELRLCVSLQSCSGSPGGDAHPPLSAPDAALPCRATLQTDSRAVMGWRDGLVVCAFRGTSSLANVLSDVKASRGSINSWIWAHCEAGLAWLAVKCGFRQPDRAGWRHQRRCPLLSRRCHLLASTTSAARPCSIHAPLHSCLLWRTASIFSTEQFIYSSQPRLFSSVVTSRHGRRPCCPSATTAAAS